MQDTTWKTYEDVAQFILNELAEHFGLGRIEGKQIVTGESGISWEIDAKGIKCGDEGIVIIECRCYKNSKIKQEDMAAIAYRIKDTGAIGGITVSPLPPQSGAKILAAHENITCVSLCPESTTTNYFLTFVNQAFAKVTETFQIGDIYHIEIYKEGKLIE
ncbi:hypothetical protein JQR84_24395 (plasmid) [Pseudomonas luteola]|uniref:hypothetical protein n=1 Tax=Pseudomonas TaxID=286 RepID=UPI003DA03B6A